MRALILQMNAEWGTLAALGALALYGPALRPIRFWDNPLNMEAEIRGPYTFINKCKHPSFLSVNVLMSII